MAVGTERGRVYVFDHAGNQMRNHNEPVSFSTTDGYKIHLIFKWMKFFFLSNFLTINYFFDNYFSGSTGGLFWPAPGDGECNLHRQNWRVCDQLLKWWQDLRVRRGQLRSQPCRGLLCEVYFILRSWFVWDFNYLKWINYLTSLIFYRRIFLYISYFIW